MGVHTQLKPNPSGEMALFAKSVFLPYKTFKNVNVYINVNVYFIKRSNLIKLPLIGLSPFPGSLTH